ncbi:Tim10/DDP family zinc finger-domain-containing protein [Annulohypoxylon bovei var. microspora]|nr:Tim10/DDP family zinc finger-domain-containing protein [Annulohypoxylon bovei var. microspora]
MDSEKLLSEIKQQVKTEAALENAKQLITVRIVNPYPSGDTCSTRVLTMFRPIQKVNVHCFDKCVPNPSSSLSSSEQTCASLCMEKYFHAWDKVSTAYINRIQKK